MNLSVQQTLSQLLLQALDVLKQQQVLGADFTPDLQLTRTKDRAHGDFATNIALLAAKVAGCAPQVLARQIIAALPSHAAVTKVEVAGPGFINFFVDSRLRYLVLDQICVQGHIFGESQQFAGQRVQVEFVSANPTSSLHVGHGRGAAYGASVSRLLEAVGYNVQREYYVNDAGRQMDILATSTFIRYLELCGESLAPLFAFPSNGYRGDYVKNDIAEQVYAEHQHKYAKPIDAVFANVPADAVYDAAGILISGDKERHVDGLIANARALLGDTGYRVFHQSALQVVLDDIKDDLNEFGVRFDKWFSESSLAHKVDEALELLHQKGYLYEQEGNIWFKSSNYGDEKDRVVRRKNGQCTYFAADIAYHLDKYQRGFDRMVNIWGADHHGYMARVKGAITAMGYNPDKLDILLVQFVSLWRGEQMVQMSSRSGQFVSLRELRNEVGNDAARFYYVARKSEQHIDFDLNLAVSQSKDNVVYYIQYAHARVCRIFDKLAEQNNSLDVATAREHYGLLTHPSEEELLAKLAAYPEVLHKAALAFEPHQLAGYLKELAALFHSWYNDENVKVISEQSELTQARLMLSQAIGQVIHNGLLLLGVSAPRSM